MNSPRNITVVFLLLLLCVSSYLYYPKYFAQRAMTAQLGDLLAASSSAPLPLQDRTKSSGCVIANALPDPACSPGAIFPDATLEEICISGYTKTVRNVSTKTKKLVFAEYDILYPQPHGTYEVDHIIPLAIGGSNDIANLFPEPRDPYPGFKEKDVVEIYLREEVCEGRADLHAAQEHIAHDWLSIYSTMSQSDISRIKGKYKSWSN
jgi:hypothetical protein